jgi:hypothetical protein
MTLVFQDFKEFPGKLDSIPPLETGVIRGYFLANF